MRVTRWTPGTDGATAAAIGLLAACGGDDDAVADAPVDSEAADSAASDEPAPVVASDEIGDAPPAGQTRVEVDGLRFDLGLPGALTCNIEDDTVTFSNRIGDNDVTVGGGLDLYDEGRLGSIGVTISEPVGEPGPVASCPTPG